MKTGKELWRWEAIPRPGTPGAETWKDTNNAWQHGGGGMWTVGSYDRNTRSAIWGTGNPVPIYDFEFSMIGDPMVDLATMRMRDNYEPLGESFPVLLQLYEEFSGEPRRRATSLQ